MPRASSGRAGFEAGRRDQKEIMMARKLTAPRPPGGRDAEARTASGCSGLLGRILGAALAG
ncbi:MAG: hypothetical protein LBK95_05390, partial [Bifidobacteriaceae bacterium]|nr:hypothetical protein [Bifidobacteriaceae bacterium]